MSCARTGGSARVRVGASDRACRGRSGRAQGVASALGSPGEADAGARRDLLTTSERERLKLLEREVRELRKANEILKAASVFFAKELDGTPRR